MTVTILDLDGARWVLPPLLQWEFTRTDGTSADSYILSFPCTEADGAPLRRAVRLFAEDGSEPVFTGVVDEIALSLDEKGRIATVSGRGAAALLMDSQVRAAAFSRATMADILARYVTPCGILAVKSDIKNDILSFAVDSGDTCWQALAGFCRHAANRTPRFLPDGTLDLTTPPDAVKWELNGSAQVLAAEYRLCRYGVIAEQVMVDRSTGAQTVTKNEAFLQEGGAKRAVTMQAGQTVRASIRTARQHIKESARDYKLLRVTLPGCWLAEPCDRIRVKLPALGVSGIFRVAEVTTALDASGLRCTLNMREE